MSVKCRYLLLISLCTVLFTQLASAGCLDAPRLTGINQAGAEFNSAKLPGVANKDYTYPAPADLAFIAAQGVNVIRLPIRWERIQPAIFTPLDPAELARLQATVTAAKAVGLCVLIDVHNYAKYYGTIMGGNTQLQNAFVDLWVRIDAAFPDATATAYDLMNEPNYMSIAEWAALSKRTLAKLRSKNSTHLIFIGGGRWSGAHDWFTPQADGTSNAEAFKNLHDPLNRTILEVHQYANKYYSGTTFECLVPETFDPIFTRLTAWAKENNQFLFLGEFGTATTPECLATLDHYFPLMQDSVWRGWTYWASGRWWNNYAFSLNVNADAPSAQWAILKKYFYVPTAQSPALKLSAPKPPQPLKAK